MTSRTWVYQTMTSDSELAGLVMGFYQSTSLNKAPDDKPFIMYRQTSDVSYARGDDVDQCGSNGFMIFAHDLPGDYMLIDSICDRLKILFADVNDPENGIIRSSWVETSDDIRDDDMGTITKFVRIQVIYKITSLV